MLCTYLRVWQTLVPFSFPSASRRFAHQPKPLQPPADSPDNGVLPNATLKPSTADAATEAESLHWRRQQVAWHVWLCRWRCFLSAQVRECFFDLVSTYFLYYINTFVLCQWCLKAFCNIFSAVKGKTPQVGDRVLVEAVYNPNMPFKWNAQRIQTLPQLANQSVRTFRGCTVACVGAENIFRHFHTKQGFSSCFMFCLCLFALVSFMPLVS